MAVAAFAAYLRAHHSVTAVLNVADVVGIKRLVKTRPSRAGFEFGAGSKQGQAAQPAPIRSILLVVEETAAKGRLGSVVEHNPALLGVEPLRENIALGVAQGVE